MDLNIIQRELRRICMDENLRWYYDPFRFTFVFDTGDPSRRISDLAKEDIEFIISQYSTSVCNVEYK